MVLPRSHPAHASAHNQNDQHDPAEETHSVAGGVGPEVGEEGGVSIRRDLGGKRLDEHHGTGPGQRMAEEAGEQGAGAHDHEEDPDGPEEGTGTSRGSAAGPGDHGEGNAQQQSDPPGGDDSPADTQPRG